MQHGDVLVCREFSVAMTSDSFFVARITQKALIVHEGKVLIVFDQKWELPGGTLHVGESPQDGLRREIQEELGVEIDIRGIHDAFSYTGEKDGQGRLCVVYTCTLLDPPDRLVLDGRELTDSRWVSSKQDLENLPFFPFFRETIEKYF